MSTLELLYAQAHEVSCRFTAEWEDPDVEVGDVRYCHHRKIIRCVRVGYHHPSLADDGTRIWETVSPLWHPIAHYRAKKELSL